MIAANNVAHLLVKRFLPLQYGIEVIGSIGPLLGTNNGHLNHVVDDLFQRTPVFLIHRQQEERQHEKHHAQSSGTVPDGFSQQKEQRNTYQRTGAEADQLSLGQIEHDLGFHFGQVFGYRYISHFGCLLPLVSVEYRLCKGAGLEEREAQQDCISHASPDRSDDVSLC